MNTTQPPTPPPNQPASGWNYPPPQPHVVHIQAKPGGFARAITFVGGMFLFAIVFMIGLISGIVVMFAGSTVDSVVLEHTWRDGQSGNRIAILPVEGVIDGDRSAFLRDAVAHILDSKRFRAVILRVDSPGGGVTASDEIWYEIERLRSAGLPVIASYGGVAASGGYYVSCAADHIIAQPTCVTGSIGVIAQVITLEGLMDKVGVEPVTLVASGSPNKSVANDTFRSWNANDRAKVISMLDASYETFVDRVANGRASALDASVVRTLADGSVYTAQEALNNKLIDGIGYLDDAILLAEQRLKIPAGSALVMRLDSPPSLFGGLLAQADSGVRQRKAASPWNADQLRSFVNELSSPRIMYLMW